MKLWAKTQKDELDLDTQIAKEALFHARSLPTAHRTCPPSSTSTPASTPPTRSRGSAAAATRSSAC
eukprot:3287581-Prymnesium_polylepis.1